MGVRDGLLEKEKFLVSYYLYPHVTASRVIATSGGGRTHTQRKPAGWRHVWRRYPTTHHWHLCYHLFKY